MPKDGYSEITPRSNPILRSNLNGGKKVWKVRSSHYHRTAVYSSTLPHPRTHSRASDPTSATTDDDGNLLHPSEGAPPLLRMQVQQPTVRVAKQLRGPTDVRINVAALRAHGDTRLPGAISAGLPPLWEQILGPVIPLTLLTSLTCTTRRRLAS